MPSWQRIRCKGTVFFRIVQVFYAICPIFLLSYRDNIGEKRLPCAGTAYRMGIRNKRRMCAYMGNTANAIRCVCLWIMVGGGHTGFVSLFIQNKNRERSEDLSRTLSIVCASKLRFNGRYMDVLRSPQELEIIGDPSAKHLTLYTTLSVAKTLLRGLL